MNAQSPDFSSYISPFSLRYGSKEMRNVFSEENKYKLWRRIWIALAEEQYKAGLITKPELEDLKNNEIIFLLKEYKR